MVIGVGAVGLHAGSSLAFVVPPTGASTVSDSQPTANRGAASKSTAPRPSSAARFPAGLGAASAGSDRREDMAGCHPGEDISCTVVRETSGGLVVFTRAYRDGSQVAVVPAAGVPVLDFGGSGVCVVPGRSVLPLTATSRYPNGAPILE